MWLSMSLARLPNVLGSFNWGILVVASFLAGPLGWWLGTSLFSLSGLEQTLPPERIGPFEVRFHIAAVLAFFVAITIGGHVTLSHRMACIAVGAVCGATISIVMALVLYCFPETWFVSDHAQEALAGDHRQQEWAGFFWLKSPPITTVVGGIAGFVYSRRCRQSIADEPPNPSHSEPRQ